jgi:type VII secretion-associated serine protease mycosin
MRSRWLPAVVAVLLGAVASVLVGVPAVADPTTVRGAQWYLTPYRIAQAQKVTRGGGVLVAVVDTGIDSTAPALVGQIVPGTAIGGGGDGTGTQREFAHGTGMAGVIAGKGDNDNQELGVAPAAKILAVGTGADANGRTTSIAIAAGIRWAVDHGAKVINVSYGHPGPATDDEVSAVDYALAKDAVVVASAGNVDEGDTAVTAPASIPGVIAVAGVDRDGTHWSGSASGPGVVLSAPAVGMVQTAPKTEFASGYALADGTSPAAALVSGVAALVRARYPNLPAAGVVNRLIRTAKDAGDKGRDGLYGYGAVDPLGALTADVPSTSVNPLLPSPSPSAAPPTTPGVVAPGTGIHQLPKLRRYALPAAAGALGLLLIVLIIGWITARRRRSRLIVPVASPAMLEPPQPYVPEREYPPGQLEPLRPRQPGIGTVPRGSRPWDPHPPFRRPPASAGLEAGESTVESGDPDAVVEGDVMPGPRHEVSEDDDDFYYGAPEDLPHGHPAWRPPRA